MIHVLPFHWNICNQPLQNFISFFLSFVFLAAAFTNIHEQSAKRVCLGRSINVAMMISNYGVGCTWMRLAVHFRTIARPWLHSWAVQYLPNIGFEVDLMLIVWWWFDGRDRCIQCHTGKKNDQGDIVDNGYDWVDILKSFCKVKRISSCIYRL